MANRLLPDYAGTLVDRGLIAQLSSIRLREAIPHALLFCGDDGGEALPLALAFARHILCEDPGEDACGHCESCRQMDLWDNPDFYLCYPVIKADSREVTSEDLHEDFSSLLESQVRFSTENWRAVLKGGNKQPHIFVAEADRLIHITSLSSFKSRHQVVLIWQPETMREDTANKLLKLLEEPPKGVIFLAVSHDPSRLLETILSRFQRVDVPPIEEDRLVDYLVSKCGADPEQAYEAGHLARGNLLRAMRLLEGKAQEHATDLALSLMETAMQRTPKAYREFANQAATLSRPEVISLIDATDRMLREMLALSYGTDDIIYTRLSIRDRIRRVSEAVPLSCYPGLMDDLSAARLELMQNASIKIVFFDLLVTMAMLIPKR